MKKGRRKLTDGVFDSELAEETANPQSMHGGAPSAKRRISELAGSAVNAVSRHRLILIRTVLPAAYTLLFGSTGSVMGIYPFGISAVCATASGAPAAIAAATAAVSSLFLRGGFYIMAVCALSASILALIRKLRGRADGAPLRAALSMIAGAVQTAAFSIHGGVSFYEICAILMSAVICPVFTVALRGLFMHENTSSHGYEYGIYILLYTAVFVLRGASYTGASAATVVSMLSVLYAAYAFGLHRGVVTGLAVGLAAETGYFAIYAAAGGVAGLLIGISPIGAVMAAVLTAVSLGIAGTGASAFGELFPELMFCAAVAGPVLHYNMLPRYPTPQKEGNFSSDISEIRLRHTMDRLRALSDSLGSVGTVMRRMSKVFSRPSFSEARQMCDDAFDESCQACDGRGMCWDKEYRATATAVNRMASEIRQGKTACHSSLPEGMRGRCPHSGAIISRINMGMAALTRSAAVNDSTAAAAEDYTAMSRLIDEVSAEGDDFTIDTDATEALAERLGYMGLRSASVSVYGSRRRLVTVTGLQHGCPATGEEIHAAVESVLGGSFSMPEYQIDGRAVSLEIHTSEQFTVRAARSSLAKRGEQCGDSITSFKGIGGYFYTLISDGMGSGGEAAVTSSACAMFLERMLGAGCTLVSAAKMLNSFLTRRNMECFATIDVMEADLITGELRFLKSGAAPSFILRDGKLYKLSSKTVPVGIVNTLDTETLTFSARAGDYVIMLSDGVVPDGEEPSWLYTLLCGAKPYLTSDCDLKEAADGIAKTASERSGYADDVSVGIISITEA